MACRDNSYYQLDRRRRMKRRIVVPLTVAFSVILCVRPMDKDIIISQATTENIFYRFSIPLEIMNYIASFLNSETKEDFIARSKKAWLLPLSAYELQSPTFAGLNVHNGFFPECEHTETLYTLSYDGMRIVLLKVPCVVCCETCLGKEPHLAIVNLKTDTKEYEGICNKRRYQQIALCQSGDILATIEKQERGPEEILHYYKDVVVIHKIGTQEPQTLQEIHRTYLPDRFVASVIAFNKQGTSLIVHGDDYSKIPSCAEYKIFSLKRDVPQKVTIGEDKNHLRDYFNHALVCKTLSSS